MMVFRAPSMTVIRRACGPGRVRTVLVFGGVFLSCSSLIVGVPGGPGRRKIEVWTMFGLGPMMVTSFWTMLWLSWGRLFRGPKKGPQIYKFWGPKMDPNCAETNSKWVSAKRPSIEPRKTQKKSCDGACIQHSSTFKKHEIPMAFL